MVEFECILIIAVVFAAIGPLKLLEQKNQSYDRKNMSFPEEIYWKMLVFACFSFEKYLFLYFQCHLRGRSGADTRILDGQ